MDDTAQMLTQMRERIHELEDKVASLRISRRVLMNLIESTEKEKKKKVEQLATEKEKLQRKVSYYAKMVMCLQQRVVELEDEVTPAKVRGRASKA